MQYEYLELRYFNNTKEIQEAVLKNERFNNILANDLDWNLSVVRFDCSNRRIPCFIPRIEEPSDDIFKDDNGNYHPQFLENPTSFSDLLKTEFPTNLQVMVQYTDDVDVNGVKNVLVGDTVIWKPENVNEPRPTNITRSSVFANRYFHSYSQLHIAELVATAIDNCLDMMCLDLGITVPSNTKVDTLDGDVIILIPKSIGTGNVSRRYDIIFNQELKQMFGFRTTPHPTIRNAHILRRTGDEQVIQVGITNAEYCLIPSIYHTSHMFPFKSIIFSSNDLDTEPLMRYNNVKDENNASSNVITDLLLTVDDTSRFYDSLVYQPQNYDRKIMVNTASIRNVITIRPYLESDDGLVAPLYIEPYGTCSIMLQFSAMSE